MKLKAGTEFTRNGKPVWVEHDLQNGFVNVCDAITRLPSDNYEVVGIDTLFPKNNGSTGRKFGSTFLRTRLTPEKKSEKEEMRAFFKSLEVPFNCAECGKPLYAYGEFAKRCVSAHILPKNSFESVKTCADNIVYLGCDLVAGVCDCHTFYDYSVENRIKMKIYPAIVERFETKLKHLLTDKELVDALDYLGL